MDKEIPPTIFTPIKKPIYSITKKVSEKNKYLDSFYSEDWRNNFFKLKSS